MENKNKKPYCFKKYNEEIPEYENDDSEDGVKEIIVERNKGFNTIEVIVIIFISVLFGIIVGYVITSGKNSLVGQEVSPEIGEFITTYNSILDNYYDSVDGEKLMNAAISGMVNSLDDPYSSFIDSEDVESFNQLVDGLYTGIGVTVQWKDGKSYIVDVFDDSPAKKAGLKVNDVIIKIGQKDVSNMDLSDISELIKGKNGSKVKIVVLRDEKEISVNVTRSEVIVPSVSSKVFNKDGIEIGYIHIDSFAANTYKQFKEELETVEDNKIDSLIIDVRENPGGHLSQVNKVLELFFPKNTVLYQIETKGKKEKVYSSTADKRNYPIVVIVNESSASASEILTASFQEKYKNAIIIGTKTYGKGTVQKAIELSSGATLKYTTQKWLTAKGQWINGVGISPDYFVEQSGDYNSNKTEESDTQLQKAINLLIEKESK